MRLSIIRRRVRLRIQKTNKYCARLISSSYFKALFILNLIALFNLYSTAGRKAVITQSTIFIVGTIIAIIVSNLNYDRLKSIAIPAYISICGLVAAVAFMGIRVNGARRWLGFHSFTIQPAELLKLSLILIIAFYLQARIKPDTRDGREYNLLDLIVPLALTIVPIALILKQPDLGTAIICLLITGTILFFMGIEKRTLIIIISGLFVVGIGSWKHLKPYQKDRVEHFLTPDIDYRGKNWQRHQSLLAIGSGGLFGVGEKLGPINQLGYLPEKNTDFALSSLAEEHGFVSIVFVLALINFIVLKLFFIAHNARDRFSSVVVIGVSFWVGFQAVINTCMCAGLLPVVGIPFPVISYGGSSLLALLLSFGFVANIDNRKAKG